MDIIRVEDLKKEYQTAVALRGVDLQIEKGQWVSIVGPSGSGKSTLLNILGGLDHPTDGRVLVNGTDINTLSEDELSVFRRENIGFVFQQSHLIPYLDATENVMLAQFFHSIPDREEAEEALRRVGLGHRLNHRPSQLSGGEQQRVCIARSLINNPSILLADEPTGNLDRANTKNVLELLKTLHEDEHFTIVLVTHDPYVSEWAERVVHMEDGRVISDETRTP
ncbi:MAG: ABC transporter ATP-binding protein [Nitrospirae bacterium]|nr:MAG: ABC transporter ATP-binding protein [Nitrospirota bacterium]